MVLQSQTLILKERLWFHTIDMGLSSCMDKMWWWILVLDLSLFTLVSICASWSSVTAWSHNLSSNLVFSDPEFWPSHHDARKESGNTGLAHTASAMSSQHNLEHQHQLHKLATPIVPSHFPPNCSTLYPTPAIRDTQHSSYNPRWAHIHATFLHKHQHVHLMS